MQNGSGVNSQTEDSDNNTTPKGSQQPNYPKTRAAREAYMRALNSEIRSLEDNPSIENREELLARKRAEREAFHKYRQEVREQETWESISEAIDAAQNDLDSRRETLSNLKRRKADRRETEAVEEEISSLKVHILSLERDRISLPDDQQPWFGNILATYNNGAYYVQDNKGEWGFDNEENIKRRLHLMGITNQRDKDACILRIRNTSRVDYVGPIPGHEAGVSKKAGERQVLVTKGTRRITGLPGRHHLWRGIIDGMLEDKATYFYSWVRQGLDSLRICLETGEHEPGHVMIMAGPTNSGKSLIQNVLLRELFGGGNENVKPYKHISGDTSFNGDWANSGNHVIEDEIMGKDRNKVDNHFKNYAGNSTTEIHPKGCPQAVLKMFKRLSVSTNTDGDCLKVIPRILDHLADKILILNVHHKPMPMRAVSPDEKRAFREALLKELPQFVWWLENEFRIPEELVNHEKARNGFVAFQDPHILEEMATDSPEMMLLERLTVRFLPHKGDDLMDWQNRSGLKGKLPQRGDWIYLGSVSNITNNLPLSENKTWVGRNLNNLIASGCEELKVTKSKGLSHYSLLYKEPYTEPQTDDPASVVVGLNPKG
jgi:hypothetical protein